MEGAYLYLQAPGFAAMRSNPFLWLGSHGDPFGDQIGTVKISFPRGKPVTLQTGDSAALEVTFRKPAPRYLRLTDENGDPVSGVKVTTYMFWSRSNHCGYPSGADRLDSASSDRDGRVRIPDRDFEYRLEFEKELYYPRAEGSSYKVTPDIPRLLMNLKAEETTIVIDRSLQEYAEVYRFLYRSARFRTGGWRR